MRYVRLALLAFIAGAVLAACGRDATGVCTPANTTVDTIRADSVVTAVLVICR